MNQSFSFQNRLNKNVYKIACATYCCKTFSSNASTLHSSFTEPYFFFHFTYKMFYELYEMRLEKINRDTFLSKILSLILFPLENIYGVIFNSS